MHLVKLNLLTWAYFCGARDQTQAFTYARQAVYHCATPPTSHEYVEGGNNLRFIPQAPFAWRLPSRLGGLADKPQGPVCLCLPSPGATSTHHQTYYLFCFVLCGFWALNSGPHALHSKHLIELSLQCLLLDLLIHYL